MPKLNVLVARVGQLSGDGQLRESFSERRSRRGEDYPMWYLNPNLVAKFKISENNQFEAVIAEDSSSIAWLKLRFGGERFVIDLDIDELWECASELPPIPDRKEIGLKRNNK